MIYTKQGCKYNRVTVHNKGARLSCRYEMKSIYSTCSTRSRHRKRVYR